MPTQPTSSQLIEYLEKYKDKNSVKLGNALIDLLLLCVEAEDFLKHIYLLEMHISNLITVLKDFVVLKKLCEHIASKTDSDFQKIYMCYLTQVKDKTDKDLVDHYMDEHLGASLSYLLNNDLIDPTKISINEQKFIEYFLSRESKSANILASIHYFQVIIRSVVSFSERFHLPHPLYARGDFSPLSCILKNNLSFAYDIINMYDKYDWKKELFFKMPDGISVIWIPFLQNNFTENSSLSFVTNRDIKGDIKNITQQFIESLATTDLEEIAKDVLFNALKYQMFFDVLTHNISSDCRSLLDSKNVLQQQIILHKHRNKKMTPMRIAFYLQKSNFNESDFFHHYELVQAVLTNFKAIRHLLDDICIEDLKQIVVWYNQIFDHLGHGIKTNYIVQSGRSIEENNLPVELKQEIVDVNTEDEVKSELNFLIMSLKDPKFTIKKIAMDQQITDLTLRIKNISNKKFKKRLENLLKEINTLKSNLVEFKNGVLKYLIPVEPDRTVENEPSLETPLEEEKATLPETPMVPAKPLETAFHFFQPVKKALVVVNSESKYELDNEEAQLAELIQQERDELDRFLASNANPPAPRSPRPTYIPIEDKNRAFQEYIYLYLRHIHAELDIFIQRITFQDQSYSKQFSLLERELHQKVINHIKSISKSLLENVLSTFPLPPAPGTLPPAEVLWDTMELKRECSNRSIASTHKFDIAFTEVNKTVVPFTSSEIIKLFYTWNKWLKLNFESIEILSSFNGYKKLKAHLEFLQNTFHQSFLPQRYETEVENRHHAFAVQIYQLFCKKISEKQIDTCSRILEHGTQVNDYLTSNDHFSSDMDICIEMPINKKHFQDLRCAFQETVEEIQKKYPARLLNYKEICQGDDKKYFLFELEFENNYKIDCQISLTPFEKTCPGRMIPYAMLGYNLLTKTIYNPISSLDFADLFTLMNPSPEQRTAWAEDAPKMTYLLKLLAKTYQVIPKEQAAILMSMIENNFKTIMADNNTSTRNALTALFGKDSLRIAGLLDLLIQHNLVSIFGLSMENPIDAYFLNWMNSILQNKENNSPGWSRSLSKNITPIQFLTLILIFLNEKHPEISLNKIASWCFAPPIAKSTLALLDETIRRFLIYGNKLPICKYFPLQTLFFEIAYLEQSVKQKELALDHLSEAELVVKQGLYSPKTTIELEKQKLNDQETQLIAQKR